jgi:PAS domain S-box-containing protein
LDKSLAKKRIVVVDDDQAMIRLLRNRLHQLGYRLAGYASTGEEAFQVVADCKPDIVLMDIMLGASIEGIHAAEQIRKRFDVPVIFLTAIEDEDLFQLAKISEPYGYILKPFKDRDLRNAIEVALLKHTAEKRIRKSEERYRSLINNMHDGFVVTDVKDVFILVNPRMCEIFGCTQEAELLGHSIYEFMEENQRKIVRAATRRRRRGASDTYEVVIRRLNGKPAVIRISASPIFDEQGKYIGSSAVVTDLTEQKQLRQLEASLYAIAEAAYTADSLDQLYSSIHAIIMKLMPARNFYIALVDPEEQIITWPYFVDDYSAEETTTQRKIDQGITEYVIRQGRSVFIDQSTYRELIENGEVKLFGALPVQWLGVPLKIEGECIGVVVVQTYSDKVTLTDDHRRVLEFVSHEVAQAISRKRVEEEVHRKSQDLALVNALNEAINQGKSLAQVFDILSRETKKIFAGYGASIYLYDPSSNHLVLKKLGFSGSKLESIQQLIGMKIPPLTVPFRKGSPYYRAIVTGKPYVVTGKRNLTRLASEFLVNIGEPGTKRYRQIEKLLPAVLDILKIQTTAIIPMVGEDTRLGCIELSRQKAFTANDLHRLETIARQLTNAIQHRQIEQERENLIAELQEALENIRTLKGLIPVCAWCHKVRDDEGYWQQVDAYLETQTGAEITHGICPECAEKHLRHKTHQH